MFSAKAVCRKIKQIIDMTPIWIKYLPAFVRRHLEGRHNLQQILVNTGWLFGDNILRVGVGLLVGVWLARYLGPAQFGMLSYAMAFIALFGAVANLGLNGIVVRDLVKDPGSANATLGTALVLQALGSVLAFALAVLTINFARPDDELTKFMIVVLGSVMVFKSTEVVKYWFESQVQSKYTVWVENGAFLLFAAVKVALILAHATLMAFVWSAFAEGALIAGGLLGVYAWRGGQLLAWQGHYQRAKILLKDSWPLIFSGLAVMIYMRIDQIMLGQMTDDNVVGLYSAAVRISEGLYFIPMAIVASTFPALMQIREKEKFTKRFQNIFDVMLLISLPAALVLSFFSENIIVFLFGQKYLPAAEILQIHAWVAVFAFLGVPSGRWYLYENLQLLALYRTVLGALINIAANYILIPTSGAIGAAYATLGSYFISNILFNLLTPETRPIFFMQAKSLVFSSFRS